MISQMTDRDFDLVVRNNVKGTFAPTKFAAILFRQQRSGRIVNMTSDAGLGRDRPLRLRRGVGGHHRPHPHRG